jgi:enoyl-CoA hydratase/carnithine racemase
MAVTERDQIRLSIEDGVAHVLLNRPAVHNAISKTMWIALPAVLQNAQQNGARVVIIAGEGKSFASGADIGELKSLSTEPETREYWLSIWRALNFLAEFPLPTLAAIRGSCFGGGCLLAAACDLRYATADAMFGVPVARFGIKLDDDNIARFVWLVGVGSAKEILFTGQPFSAERALAIGFINGVFDEKTLDTSVAQVALWISQNSLASITQTKAAIARMMTNRVGTQDQHDMIQSYLSLECRERLSRT